MDVLGITDFPDFRLKSAIQSANEGNLRIIPREGGYLVRLYIELEKLNDNERSKPERHARSFDCRGAAHPASLFAGGEGNRVVVGSTRSASAYAQYDNLPETGQRKTASRGRSSPATPAIPTAPKPDRA